MNPIRLPKDFRYPNGITHSSIGTVYVGSITSGDILQISPNDKGKADIKTFFGGNEEIFAVTTLRLDEPRGILWGSSPDVLGTIGKHHRFFANDIL